MTKDIQWKEVLEEIGAFWVYSGKNSEPHAELTSGLHSDTFYNGAKLVENPDLLKKVSAELAVKFRKHQKDVGIISLDRVLAPAMGAIFLGFEMANILGVKFAHTETDIQNGQKIQSIKRFDIKKNERVLIVEDAISTGKSFLEVIDLATKAGATVLPVVVTIINRSGKEQIHGYKIISLIESNHTTYKPNKCPFCAQGSKALRPKGNWAKFKNI